MTRKTEDHRWRCRDCNAVSGHAGLLRAPSPFDPGQNITGCPSCKQCGSGFDELCDEPGCGYIAQNGWPTGDDSDAFGGYRRTCYQHSEAD